MSLLTAAINGMTKRQVQAIAAAKAALESVATDLGNVVSEAAQPVEQAVTNVVTLATKPTPSNATQIVVNVPTPAPATQGTPKVSMLALMQILMEVIAAAPGIESTVEEAVSAFHKAGETNAQKVGVVASAGASLLTVAAQLATAQAAPAPAPAATGVGQ